MKVNKCYDAVSEGSIYLQKTLDFEKSLFVAIATVSSDCIVLQRARH